LRDLLVDAKKQNGQGHQSAAAAYTQGTRHDATDEPDE
jgi:hypothetical protein